MDNYFYLNASNQQVGPVPAADLKGQGVGPNTLVWKQGMPAWAPAGQVPELSSFFGRATAQPTPPPTPQGGYQPGGQQAYGQQMHGAYQAPVQQQGHQQQGYQQQQGFQQQSGYQYQPTNEAPPSNNLVWAILATLLCCLPFGIVAIVYAAKVDGLWARGLHEEARQAAKNAQTWSIVSAATGLVVTIIYIIALAAA